MSSFCTDAKNAPVFLARIATCDNTSTGVFVMTHETPFGISSKPPSFSEKKTTGNPSSLVVKSSPCASSKFWRMTLPAHFANASGDSPLLETNHGDLFLHAFRASLNAAFDNPAATNNA